MIDFRRSTRQSSEPAECRISSTDIARTELAFLVRSWHFGADGTRYFASMPSPAEATYRGRDSSLRERQGTRGQRRPYFGGGQDP
jgi:hypothetical protein